MLVATLVLVAVISTVLVAVMAHVSQEHRMLARTATWNSALPVAEAALEEAMSHMAQVQLGTRAVNGWTISGTNVARSRFWTNSNSRYSVAISSATPPWIYSTGEVWNASANRFVQRRIVARTRGETFFMKGISAKQTIDMSGQIVVDSFDSANPLYNTGGQYDVTKRKDGGDIGTNQNTPGAMTFGGQAQVHGDLATGPLGTVSVTGGNVKIGTSAFIAGGGSGLQTNMYTKDMNVSFSDVTLPYTNSLNNLNIFPPTVAPLPLYTLGGSDYHINSLSVPSGRQILVTGGNARLVVTANINITGEIVIQPGASLHIYLRSGTVYIAGNGLRNQPGLAYAFGVWCLPAVTTVTIAGNGEFTGTIYAPSAAVTMDGSGGGGLDFSGALVARTFTGAGNFNFHFDEDLMNRGMRNLIIASWKEL
jgi:hypothetical protein